MNKFLLTWLRGTQYTRLARLTFGFLFVVASSIAYAQPSATQTLLPSGHYLQSGGGQSPQIVSDLSLLDAATQQVTTLTLKLATPRTAHSATLLPDGKVLILGGVGQDGYPVASAEILDLTALTVQVIASPGLLARSQHRATLLTDGKVLITGGLDAAGQAIGTADLWNPKTQQPESLRASLLTARANHIAQLLANAPVLITGGQDASGKTVTSNEQFDPQGQRFDLATGVSATDLAAIPSVAEIIPPADGFDIAVDGWIVVRFNKALKVDTLNAATVTLRGPTGLTAVQVVPTEGGMLLFVTSTQSLLPGSQYTLFISGATDSLGQALPFTASSFKTGVLGTTTPGTTDTQTNTNTTGSATTGTETGSGTSASTSTGTTTPTQAAATDPAGTETAQTEDTDEDWTPSAQNYKGEWKSDRAKLANNYPPKRIELQRAYLRVELGRDGRLTPAKLEAKLPALTTPAAAPGVTALVGQALKLNGRPLAGVTVGIGNQSAVTDANGEFLLTGIPVGKQVLSIEGQGASSATRTYGRYAYQMMVEAGKVNALPQPIWMSSIDSQHAVKIASPTTQEVVIINPKMPGLEVRIPAGAVIRDADGNIVTEVSLTPVPADQTPFTMPYDEIPIYYTLQPGGATIQSVTGKPLGAKVVYPNYSTQPNGARFELFDYDPGGRGWYVYGTATVSDDGARLISDKDFVIYQFTATSAATSGALPAATGPKPKDDCRADPVSCNEGLFLEIATDMSIKDVMPISIKRIYRQGDATQRAFGVGADHGLDMYLFFSKGNSYDVTEITLVTSGSTQIPFTRISGTSYIDGAVYESNTMPNEFYKAKLSATAGYGSDFIVTLKDGRKYGFSYYGSWLKWVEDRHGNRISITRGLNYSISRITSPNGRYIDFEYLATSCTKCATKATDYTGRYVKYEYDTAGRLWKVYDLENNLTQYTYDTATHRMLTVKEPRFATGEVTQPKVTNEYYTSVDGVNLDGRVKKQTYADLTTASFAYTFDTSNKVTYTDYTNERGAVERINYNANGYITSTTKAFGQPEAQTTSYDLDPVSNLTKSMTDALGRVTAYGYNATTGNLETLTRMQGTPEQAVWSFTYEPTYNQVATATDPLVRTVQFTYDTLGSLTEIKNLGNNTKTTMTYTPSGQIETQTAYTGTKELVTRYTYDYGDLIAMTDPLSRTTNYFTDNLGRVAAVTDPLNNITFIDYDKLDRVRFQTDALYNATEYQYDPNGNLKLLKDAKQNTTSYTYDPRNRVQTMTDPLQKVEKYEYDAAGNLKFFTDRKGQVTGHTYDFLDRRTQIGFGGTAANPTAYTRTIDTTYDAGNRPTLIADSQSGNIDPDYDGYDRLTRETTPNGQIDYTYFANGLRQTQTVLGQASVNYNYDSGSRPTQITQGSSIVGFGFDEANRRTSLTLPNGVTLTYTLDDASQVTKIEYTQGVLLIGDLTYAYDQAGRRIQMGGSLAKANMPSDSSASFNAANRMTQFNTRTLSYDDNGNLTSDGLRSYTWDATNRLANISGSATGSFQYDAFGRRQSKTINGVQTGYFYDGPNPVQELTGITPKANMLTGGIDEFFTRTDATGTQSFMTDALGSTLALTDSAGNLTTQYSYEAYGNTTQSGAASDNSFQYTGRENDSTGLMYYRARYYDPELARFISEDPIGFAGGINLAAYVGGNPISFRDPLGLEVFVCSQPAFGWMPVDHQWIKTDTVEAGMGGTRGNEAGNESGDMPGDPVQVVNEKGRSNKEGASCKKVEGANEKIIDELLKPRPLGNWGPTNNCQTFVEDVLSEARRTGSGTIKK